MPMSVFLPWQDKDVLSTVLNAASLTISHSKSILFSVVKTQTFSVGLVWKNHSGF